VNADAPALVARARGLRQRLAPLVELVELCSVESPQALLEALARRRLLPVAAPGRGDAEALEIGFRQRAAELLAILQRWRGRGRDVLALVFAEEERHCLRALLRGAAAGAAPETRLAGLIPTPDLPLRRLEELSRAADPLAVAARLATRGWPDAEALAAAAAATRPDLAAMERTLRWRFGARLRDAARDGDRELRREIGLAIDLDNAAAAAALAGGGESAAEDDFLAGGRELSRELFRRATETASSSAALALLAGAFSDAAIAGAVRTSLSSPARLGERLVAARLVRATAEALQRPLGVAPVLELALALRAEGLALSRLVWGLALEAPAAERRGAAA
jgi:vacuolar-type H+-ATPase subunit C/Vma6